MPSIQQRASHSTFALLLVLLSIPPVLAEIERDDEGNLAEYSFATMSDGVKIALAVGYPEGFDPKNQTKKWPAVFEMSGYKSATKVVPGHKYYDNLYITVNASLRGTGASGGRFSAFSDRSTRDGYEIIENWIVKQPWSNGRVGIQGHSWTGLTGFRVAATKPPHLQAVVVSGLFDDAVRGLAGIGGIRNVGFPVKWTSNFQRTDGVFGSDEAAIKNRQLSAAEAGKLQTTRQRPVDTASDVVRQRSRTLRELASQIQAPIFLLHAYQDHETGPSGVWLFDQLPKETTKRLLISNGHHGMPIRFIPRRRAWFDYWLLGRQSKFMPRKDVSKSLVEAFFEVENSFARLNAPFVSRDFPLPETQWTRYYFQEENALSTSPAEASATDSYEAVRDEKDDRIDGVECRMAFEKPTAICGPIVVTLWASCTTKDTDFFVVLSDIAPDGRARALQRGMLRASLRSVDKEMSRWVTLDGEQVLVRPHHSLDASKPLEPGKPYRFDIEVFPVGHVFRDGHQLSLSIGPAPESDPVPYPAGRPKLGGKVKIKSGSYKYESSPHQGTVTIHRSREYPSSILLPLLPNMPSLSAKLPVSIDQMWTETN